MRSLELLAPAKNLACGIAAIDHGADAVYIGAERYGARAAAGNSVEDIAALCRYAHQFGAKVYVTTNTIIYDEELEDTFHLMKELQGVGVDAFLVQDMGIVQEFRSSEAQEFRSSGVQLHASTQTDNRTAEKVGWLRSLGFSRVVLARELSLEEIREIHQQEPDVELEVFVHGALCVSYSGQCYASQYCLGRSANRGECAQMCRMKYDLVDGDGKEIEHQRYLLSLKDMCRINDLEALADAGAVSFKIEGRLKDVDYVKNVVAAYSQRLNELIRKRPDEYKRSSYGEVTYSFVPNLQKTFNRGYTDYFLHSYRDEQGVLQGRQADIASFDTPKALGEYVGEVGGGEKAPSRPPRGEERNRSIVVEGNTSFSNGDGLCFFTGRQGELVGFRVNRVEGHRLFLQQMPQGLRPGTKLYRNHDEAFSKLLQGKTAERKIPVTMRYGVEGTRKEEGGTIIFLDIHSDMGHVRVALPAEVQRANHSQREVFRRELSKLGNTPFKCVEVTGEDFFVPASVLARLRRLGVETLMKDPLPTSPRGGESPLPTSPRGGEERGGEKQGEKKASYLMNVSNRLAREFYQKQGFQQVEPAFELKKPQGALLMQCRHCIKYALGYCVKHGGKAPGWKEPLGLRLGDGRVFRLQFDCKACLMKILSVFLLLFLVSCYGNAPQSSEALPEDVADTIVVGDSLSFKSGRHYSVNYNFVVKADSIILLRQQPEELAAEFPADSFSVAKGAHLVVADIRLLDGVGTDSVWVQVATEQSDFGWIHESCLLPLVVPDDPISQFISFFSDTHILVSLFIVIIIGFVYLMRGFLRHQSYIVHFNDIESFYPTLLMLIVAFAATFYASIQMFAPDAWRHFYYHPTLNPFAVPPLLTVFLVSVWSMFIVALAAADDVRRQLTVGESLTYLAGLAGMCAVNYIVFSITTLYYVGYLLLAGYTTYCLRSYNVNHRWRYVCGHCGRKMRDKGRCPYCGVENL